MTTVSVRLPEGLYEAVKELAEFVGIDKSDMATLLLSFGLTTIRQDRFSQRTLALVQADTLESYGSLVRVLAKATPAQRAAFDKQMGELMEKFAAIFPGVG